MKPEIKPICARKTRKFTRSIFVCYLATAMALARVAEGEPIVSVPAAGSGQPTTLSATGRIEQIDRARARIAFFSNKPFWGPPHYGRGLFALYPVDTLFIATVAGTIPITIDGGRSSFGQLAVGQMVNVQYNIVQTFVGMYCAALRIDAHTPSPAKGPTENPRKKK